MKKKLVVIGVMIVLFAGTALAAGSSASYRITTEILDSGAAAGSSTSYRLLGKIRERQLSTPSSANFSIGEGFLRSVYFSSVVPVLAPVVTSITPSTGVNTGPIEITDLLGANFQSGASVKLSKSGQTDVAAANVSVVSSGKITCTFNLTGMAGGLWDVTVVNPDGRAGVLPSAFTVTFPAPAVASIAPNSGFNNATVKITDLAGSNFRTGAAVRLAQTGQSDVIGSIVSVVSSSQITCQLDLTGKAVGQWDVKVINDDNQAGTLASGFKVEAPTLFMIKPVISTLNPYNPASGRTSLTYSLSKDANIVIYIYNIRGERVWQYEAPAGSLGGRAGDNAVDWDGLTAFRSVVSFGVYIIDVTSKDEGGFKILSRTKLAVVR